MEERNVIDQSKLERVKVNPDGSYFARCPLCAAEGGDTSGQGHLSVFPSGKFHCFKYANDKVHNYGILQLAGTKGTGEAPITQIVQPKIEVDRIYPDACLSRLVRNFDYWTGRGVEESAISRFEGGIALEGQMQGRWVFPFRNKNNQIIGFTGRWIGKANPHVAKWKHLGVKSKSHWPFFTHDEINSLKKVVLVESPGDTLACVNSGILAIRCLFGINLSSAIMGELIGLQVNQIIISTNNDMIDGKIAGNKASEKIRKQLIPFFGEDAVIIRLPQTASDWGAAKKEELLEFYKEIYVN